MRKNRMMRLASALLILTMVTTCAISGTFAKYTTSATGTDTARVAVWGINKDTVAMDLFDESYGNVNAADGDNVIAPGTTKTNNISILNASTIKPEVAYTLTVSVAGSSIHEKIKANDNITWKLDNGTAGTWDDLMTAILRLSGDTTVTYAAGTTESVTVECSVNSVPAAFENGKTHTITWDWDFGTDEADDIRDTEMGNLAASGDLSAVVAVTITATQVN